MDEDKKACVECGMPIDEKTKCQCSEDGTEKCVHCCECEEGCECNCREKAQEMLESEENGSDEVKEDETVE